MKYLLNTALFVFIVVSTAGAQFADHRFVDHQYSPHSASKYTAGRWSLAFPVPGSNDNGNEVREEPKPGRINLSGPRFGLTLVTGRLADRLDDDFDAMPVITQFGWQFERQFIGREDGVQTLSEFVVLVGGAEQGLLLPSISWLVGVRNSSGTEFGVGPNVSVAGASLVFAFGVTRSTETLNFPINFAIAPSSDGMRFSILVGFNARD